MAVGLSTFQSYQLLAKDLQQSLAQLATDKTVKADAAYYDANIGKVTSVDDLLKNSRLYNYAMKAYGLEDMAYAKAFMKKVFKSDVNDSKSFVRQLTDPRFLKIAQAFNFSTDGKVKESPATSQETADLNDMVELYSDRHIKQGAAAATEVSYYQRTIGSVTSVDNLLSNSRLMNVVLQTFGIDPSRVSNATLKSILTSDVNDPSSFANQSGKSSYIALASAFSFNSDGSVPSGGAQPAADARTLMYGYYDATGTGGTAPAAAFKTQYYRDIIGSVTNVDDLLGNDQLLDYAVTAFGLDPNVQSKTTLRQVLTSDLSNSASVANTKGGAYKTLAAAFNFATDGSIKSGSTVQSAAQLKTTTDNYQKTYDDTTVAADATETKYYKSTIAGIGTVTALLNSSRVYRYVLNAYGLDASKESKATITKVLQSDPTNPSSFANASGNSAYRTLAAAFNFGADGKAQTASAAQVNAAVVSTITAYNAAVGDPTVKLTATKTESNYYANTIGNIQTADELVKDKRLVAYLQKAFGLGTDTITTDVLKKVLTSDPTDPKSFVNQKANTKYRALATAFNFDSDGKISLVPKLQPQDKEDRVATSDLYLRQTLEENAGSDNEGVRLALYFLRIAPTVTSAYSILADKALLQVTRTALNLPASMSNSTIEQQAALISKKLNIADLKDSKKLDKLIARFATLYDVDNSGLTTAGSIATQLISAIR